VLLDSQAWSGYAKLIVPGEIVVGATLTLGGAAGIAAFLRNFMNWDFRMAGSASTCPTFFQHPAALILAW
jgi:thiosulfate dehydrogenase (quinone) large subunit